MNVKSCFNNGASILSQRAKCQSRTSRYGPSLHFSVSANKGARNRIYTPVRRPDELSSYILFSTSSRTPLITFWTTSWCPSCSMISPLINSLVNSGVGEAEGGVTYCEVEFDSQEIMDAGFGIQYMIGSVPTLLTFDRGEMMEESRTVDVSKMRDKNWLGSWIEREARRRGEGTKNDERGGGGVDSGLLGGLFGNRGR